LASRAYTNIFSPWTAVVPGNCLVVQYRNIIISATFIMFLGSNPSLRDPAAAEWLLFCFFFLLRWIYANLHTSKYYWSYFLFWKWLVDLYIYAYIIDRMFHTSIHVCMYVTNKKKTIHVCMDRWWVGRVCVALLIDFILVFMFLPKLLFRLLFLFFCIYAMHTCKIYLLIKISLTTIASFSNVK